MPAIFQDNLPSEAHPRPELSVFFRCKEPGPLADPEQVDAGDPAPTDLFAGTMDLLPAPRAESPDTRPDWRLHAGQKVFSYNEAEASGNFCPDCVKKLPRITSGYCPLCGELNPWPLAPNTLCFDCQRQPPPWDSYVFHAPYEGLLRKMILHHKFSSDLATGFALGGILSRHPALPPLSLDMIIPVPLHTRRLQQRGYNQAMEISKGLLPLYGRRTKLMPHLLKRTRPTRPQLGLSRAERRQNVRGVFTITSPLEGHNILLVDDVYTTGSTLRECVHELRKAGAGQVHVATLARARQRHTHL